MALVCVVFFPMLFDASYPRIINTILLVGICGLVLRTAVSPLLSFEHADPPVLEGDRPDVSVIIPAYDEAAVLGDTLDACLDLDYPNEKLEVIVCYEASCTDETPEIAERAAAEHDVIRAVERDEPGGGKAAAANYALQYAEGSVIASIDADHRFEPDALDRAVRWFDDPEVWCVKGRCYGDNPDESIVALLATVERHVTEKAELFARDVMDGFTIFGGGQAFFRHDVFDEFDGFDEEILVEDIDMTSRIHEFGKEIRVDPSIITYEEHPTSLRGLWHQRLRWTRGWMQVARRYLRTFPFQHGVSSRKKADAIYTYTYAIAPAFFVLGAPLTVLHWSSTFHARTYLPNDSVFWTAFTIVPIMAATLVFLQDWRDGLTHHRSEYLAMFVLPFYYSVQSVLFFVAFVQEFVLDRPNVYVKTDR
ncbi:glycosyltransferase [Halocalculus aciditolerans]|uniref:glycosyltransferase n=1 Tax=Halocalculus aciditolerans TaxID=1383812 RepID=UPI00166C94FC|nr:glycosyltransferase family 2 protein [Halocalculus aciditolerans]